MPREAHPYFLIVKLFDGPLVVPSLYRAITTYVYVLLFCTVVSLNVDAVDGSGPKMVSGATSSVLVAR